MNKVTFLMKPEGQEGNTAVREGAITFRPFGPIEIAFSKLAHPSINFAIPFCARL